MNPVPSDAQWLILYMIDDGDVFPDGAGGFKAKGPVGFFRCAGAVRRLHQLGLIDLDQVMTPTVNKYGMEVLKRRSVYDVLERASRRRLG